MPSWVKTSRAAPVTLPLTLRRTTRMALALILLRRRRTSLPILTAPSRILRRPLLPLTTRLLPRVLLAHPAPKTTKTQTSPSPTFTLRPRTGFPRRLLTTATRTTAMDPTATAASCASCDR